jgi:hypothetical protein
MTSDEEGFEASVPTHRKKMPDENLEQIEDGHSNVECLHLVGT